MKNIALKGLMGCNAYKFFQDYVPVEVCRYYYFNKLVRDNSEKQGLPDAFILAHFESQKDNKEEIERIKELSRLVIIAKKGLGIYPNRSTTVVIKTKKANVADTVAPFSKADSVRPPLEPLADSFSPTVEPQRVRSRTDVGSVFGDSE